MYDEKEILISYIESEKYEAAQEAEKKAEKKSSNAAVKAWKIIGGRNCRVCSVTVC
jgi:hypothetical protein